MAACYAKELHDRGAYDGGVYLLDAQSTSSLQDSIRNNIDSLADRYSKHNTTLQEDYQFFLYLLGQRSNVLLVYDGCNKLDVIEDLLPTKAMPLHVIITTRQSSEHKLFDDKSSKVMQLSRLDQDHAVKAVRKWEEQNDDLVSMDEEEKSSAFRLVDHPNIAGLPLAIRHVGTYLKEGSLSYQKYLEMVEKNGTQTMIPWEVNMEEATKKFLGCRDVLNIASLMDCNNIPDFVLEQAAFPNCGDDTERERLLQEAISRLFGFSLLQKENDQFSMHSLVQESVKQAMKNDGTLSLHLRRLSTCLTRMLPQTEDEISRKEYDENLTRHCYMVASHIVDAKQQDEECWKMLQVACWLAIHNSHLRKAEELCEGKLEVANTAQNQHSELESRRHLQSLLDLAKVYLKLGKPKNAEELLQEEFDMIPKPEKIEPEEIQLHVKILDGLRQCYNDLEKFEHADRFFQETVRLMNVHHLPQKISLVMDNEAQWYKRRGYIDFAKDRYEDSLSQKRNESNVTPEELCTTLINLADCHKQMGHLDQALFRYKEAVTIYERELPSSHFLVAVAMRHLAGCYLAQGRPKEAEPLAETALLKARAVLPDGHPNLGWFFNVVAEYHLESGNINESISSFETAIDLFSHAQSLQTLALAEIKHNLALAYDEKKNTEKAMELVKESIDIKEKHSSDFPLEIAQSQIVLGGILYKRLMFKDALKTLEQGMSTLRQKTPEGIYTAGGCYWLARIAKRKQQWPKAHQYITECLRVIQAIYPHGHRRVVWAEKLSQEIIDSEKQGIR